jgi:hypothetical protein
MKLIFGHLNMNLTWLCLIAALLLSSVKAVCEITVNPDFLTLPFSKISSGET